MERKTLMTAAVAAAFAVSLSAQAADDKDKPSSASSGASQKSDGGAEAMFKALDKNKDGYISKDEAKGTPHDKDFSKLDKDSDGKLSRDEHAAAPEHASSATTGASGSGAKPESGSSTK